MIYLFSVFVFFLGGMPLNLGINYFRLPSDSGYTTPILCYSHFNISCSDRRVASILFYLGLNIIQCDFCQFVLTFCVYHCLLSNNNQIKKS